MTHPGKMLPTVSRYAIRTYTNPGDLVLGAMAGIGTTLIEAMHLGHHGVGIEYEAEWVAKAADNIRHAVKPERRAGARSTTGTPPCCRRCCRRART